MEREIKHSNGTRDKTVSSKGVQDYETPLDLIACVVREFRCIIFDLAASETNHKHPLYFSPSDDSLSKEWAEVYAKLGPSNYGFFWLNPPFKTVRPWMEKCRDEAARGCRILSLTKASIGSRWYREVVAPNAASYILGSRVTFVGETQGFTQDLMISEWGTGKTGIGYWDWKK